MVVNLRTTTTFFERSENLTSYYAEIRKHPILTQEEEMELFKIMNDKVSSPKEKADAKEKLIVSNQRFVVAVAKRYASNDTLLDLIDEGNIGLIESIDSFDINKGVKFMTWAVWYIRRAINFYLIDNDKMIKRSNKLKTYHIISQATSKFVQREQREPSMEELRDMLNDEYKIDIKNSYDLLDPMVTSIDRDMTSEDENYTSDITLFNTYSASSNTYERKSDNEFNSKLVTSLLKTLTPKESEMIVLLFGIGRDRALEVQEVAERFNYTPERIRQLKYSILEKLKVKYKTALKSI